MASPSNTLNDQANGTRLCRLLVDEGTQALREKFNSVFPPSNLAAALNTHKGKLQALKHKVINATQWDFLYPASGLPDSQNFDVSLLTILLRNICGLRSPATGWDHLPPSSDRSDAANIARIKYYRNKVYAHITKTEISDKDFENLWQKISQALIDLGIPNSVLEELKGAPLSPEEAVYIQLLEDWFKREDELIKISLESNVVLKQIQQTIQQKSRESEKVSQVKKLCKCDFSGTIKDLNDKFLTGTRQWLFNKLEIWFDDENSDSTIMILTAGPGVGKSVFAAEVCRRYKALGKLAAVHFCKYNKSDYRNPRMIIQSLASIMCDNVTGFRANLDDKLQRNHSQETLSDAFRVLLNDPLHALEERKPMLLVIDALDESETGGKSELLQLISEEFPNLPNWMKILITSRPELQVQEELNHLNPVCITPDNTNNKEDLFRYLQHFLSSIWSGDGMVELLALECEGSFLYAYHTQKELNNAQIPENIFELVPKGISGFYKKQFERLRKQLNDLGHSNVMLKSFLEVLVAAKGCLPLCLLPECLGLPNDSEYEVRNAINEVMSSIFPVYDDCLTVYHKSLIDWLTSTGYKEHAFTVDLKSGHKSLWRICEKVFNQIVSLSTLSDLKTDSLTRYALNHGISHMVQSGNEFSYHWSVDVKIIQARIMINPYCVYGLRDEYLEIIKNSLSRLNSELLQELKWHIRLFEDNMTPLENSAFYLESVVNNINCSYEKRSLARTLLKQGQYFWFEDLEAKELTNHFYRSVSLRTDVTCMSVSPDEQLVAVGYKDGWISIFRLPDFQEVHIFNTMPESKAHPPMPLGNFYDVDWFTSSREGDRYSNFGGDYGALWSCSFSLLGTRLITCDGSDKIKLWDINGGNLVERLQAGGPVDCCSFSECGLFIVASKERAGGQCVNSTDVFTLWSTLTMQRVDRRRIRSTVRFLSDKSDYQILLASNDGYIDVFQLPEALLLTRLYKEYVQYLVPFTRYHGRDCVFYHTNESIKLSGFCQFRNMDEERRFRLRECRCSYLNLTAVAPIQVRGLYIVPYFAQLNVFSVVEKPSIVSFVSEPYEVKCCCFSPDGSFLAACANKDPFCILVWDTKLCTMVQFLRFPWISEAGGCWWSRSLLWIYDGGLVKIPTHSGSPLNPSGARRVEINWNPTYVLTFSDVLIFVDQVYSVKVARIMDGELQYVERFPVGNPLVSAAVSPCNSVIFMASKTSLYVWEEDKTCKSSLHWLCSCTGQFLDFFSMKYGKDWAIYMEIRYCKCCITSDGSTGVFALLCTTTDENFSLEVESWIILVDVKSKIPKFVRCSLGFSDKDTLYAGNSYLFGRIDNLEGTIAVENLTDGKTVAVWGLKSHQYGLRPIVAHSRNDLVAIISASRACIKFFKISVPEF